MRLYLLYLTSLVSLTGLLAACGSAPKAPVPDGRHRLQVNTPDRISRYGDAAASDHSNTVRPSDDRRRIEALETQVAGLRTAVLTGSGASPATSAPPPPGCPGVATAETPAACLSGEEHMELRRRSIVFHIPFKFGAADFTPPESLRSLLLKAAADSPRIEVRGRTDADKASRPDALLALRRAEHARQFLIWNGIDPARIHASALAAGGQVADNATDVGRAQNRRVEIEAMDVNPQAYGALPTTSKGAEHEPD
jgi:outer membrane protein OmpA-like peptidoglycan-associated protein